MLSRVATLPTRGRPAEAPVRLALATLLQFMEGLTDRQAADAVRTRIDWKHLLCLALTDVGFDHTVLSEFRTRLLAHGAAGRLFEAILELARGRGLLKGGGRQRSDSTHVLGAMRSMSRLEVVGETLRHALNALATTAPDWLRAHTTPAWVDRYGLRASEFRLPKSEAGRRAWAVQTGVDGFALLALARTDGAPPDLRDAAALETLRQVWIQNFLLTEHGPEGPQVDWRANDQVPPSGRYIGSPYDAEARYATKGTTVWSGYKVHLTKIWAWFKKCQFQVTPGVNRAFTTTRISCFGCHPDLNHAPDDVIRGWTHLTLPCSNAREGARQCRPAFHPWAMLFGRSCVTPASRMLVWSARDSRVPLPLACCWTAPVP